MGLRKSEIVSPPLQTISGESGVYFGQDINRLGESSTGL
jgi:hypothetical protein